MHWRLIPIFGLILTVVACSGDDEPIHEQQPQEQVQPPPSPVAQATPEPEPEPEPEPISGPLYTVQMGAFLNADSAVVQRDRLANLGLPAWTVTQEVGGRQFRRVRIGAASTGSEARSLGEILTERYGWSTWVALVTSTESVPDGALEATRDLIGG
ncbi:MAG: SPOR domain-containing protein [Gemmatimonadales bacterium]|jgi:cell division protein FtsN|nr:SPOR domain-containing protein [Verrucomicrobiota bacterium]MBT3499885.1 SPOR domain-containing protein [Gemmatimonadales bacterium]MDG2238787.1 SPOR domain-containing protein [Longimicrobiales bacterium]MBT3775018.1 SPOR domain-containing protein [Gemmatimonadales bacterium]MBT3960042.1 SPOR domain-containing protein [Gemmatimonadales bacterium]